MAIDLFPAPQPPPSSFSPRPLPGTSNESTETLRNVLKDNHDRWHLYFNDATGYHNHASHYVIALWALGADKETIQAAYDLDCTYQLPAFPSPEAITADNFKEHLGDSKYYSAYRKYFTDIVQTKDVGAVLEEYVFDVKMNFDGSLKEPYMLTRFFEGLIHPMIHVGHGAEFGLPGMVVEGLASTAIHRATSNILVPPSLWEPKGAVESLASRLPSALDLGDKPSKNIHAITILARLLKDPRFVPGDQKDIRASFMTFMKDHGENLTNVVKEWSYDSSNPREVERKIEEVILVNVLIYGVGGWKEGEDLFADFLFMHLVTSSIFLSSIAALLKPASQELFLRSYLTTCLAFWLISGRVNIDVKGFFSADTAYPTPTNPQAPLSKNTLLPATSAKSTAPNPWFPIVQNALTIVDDHLPKFQRTLLHFAQVYGTRPAGHVKDTELPSAELIDGTLFLRVAGLTDKRVVHISNTQTAVVGATTIWDRRG